MQERPYTNQELRAQKRYDERAGDMIDPSAKQKLLSFLGLSKMPQFKGITKEDIIRTDADMEHWARMEAEGKKEGSEEQEKLFRIMHSDLTLTLSEREFIEYSDSVLQGEINGKKTRLIKTVFDSGAEPEYTGWVGVGRLSSQKAKEIFEAYGPIAQQRMETLQKYAKSQTDYSKFDNIVLDRLLEKYIKEENYLKAAEIRDENIRRGRTVKTKEPS